MGQILACPKCGSMVLVTAPPPGAAKTDAHEPLSRAPGTRGPEHGQAPVVGDPEMLKDTQPAIAPPTFHLDGEIPTESFGPAPLLEVPIPPLWMRLRQSMLVLGAGLLGIGMAVLVFYLVSGKPDAAPIALHDPNLKGRSPEQQHEPEPLADRSGSNQETSDDRGQKNAPPELDDPFQPSRPKPVSDADPDAPAPLTTPAETDSPKTPDNSSAKAKDDPAERPEEPNPTSPTPNTSTPSSAPPDLTSPSTAGSDPRTSPRDSLFKNFDKFQSFLKDAPSRGDTTEANGEPESPQPEVNAEFAEERNRIESRAEPQSVDVAARLNDPLAGIEFKEIALLDFLRLIGSLTNIPITIPPEVLEYRNLDGETRVSIRQTNTTAGKALQSALEGLDLAYQVHEGHLTITAKKWLTNSLSARADVADILEASNGDSADLIDKIVSCTNPLFWEAAGGEGTLQIEGNTLIVTNQPIVAYRSLMFLDQLRLARGLRPKSEKVAAHKSINRFRLADENLIKPVTLTFPQPVPLLEILGRMEKETGARFLVNWEGLAEARWGTDAKAKLVVKDQPLGEVLHQLLTPMDLGWRVVDRSLLEVSSMPRLRQECELETYSLAPLLTQQPDPDKWIETIRPQLGRVPHESESAIAIRFDAPSQSLLAFLPQAQQRLLAGYLSAPPH